MNRFLAKTGLSLSQAQSISNLCNQKCQDIESLFHGINNYSRSFEYDGKTHTEIEKKEMPENVMELLKEKSTLHACQAFLMEHIRLKDSLLKQEKDKVFIYNVSRPETLKYKQPDLIKEVEEDWGWKQLSDAEYAEYLEAECFASHYGQFIHKNGILDKLRKELPSIKKVDFIELSKDKKTIVNINVHHNAAELLNLHNKIAEEHRKYEQKVNYYKAKIKNLITLKNAEIAKENALKNEEISKENELIRIENENKLRIYNEEFQKAFQYFQQEKQLNIKELAALRIQIDPRFQETIDMFLTKIDKKEE